MKRSMRKKYKVIPGTGRRLRREAWARVRQQVQVQVPVHQFDLETKQYKKILVNMKVWKPSFAEFTKVENSRKGVQP